MRSKLDEFKITFSNLDQTDLFELVEEWASDIVYSEYKVEPEDITYSMKQLDEKDKDSL